MRILITTGIFPPDIGGPATYVPTIARELSQRGHQVRVLTTSEPQHLNQGDSSYPFPVQRVPRRQPFWKRIPLTVFQILRLGQQVEILYANGIYLETALANRILKKPLVMKIVGDEAWERAIRKGWTQASFDEFQQKLQSRRVEWLKAQRNWWIQQADRIIVPSEYLKRVVIGWGTAEERCRVVYNAIQMSSDLSEEPRPSLPFPQSSFRLITVCRLVPWKGVDRILRAIAPLPGVTLTVVGEGPSRRDWEDLAQELGLKTRVWFTGSLPRPAVHALLREHNVFLLISGYEGLPHIIVEALMLGVPVIATPAGGTPEVVQDGFNGLLVEATPPKIREAIQTLREDESLRHRLARNAIPSVSDKFTPSVMVARTEAVLKELLFTSL